MKTNIRSRFNLSQRTIDVVMIVLIPIVAVLIIFSYATALNNHHKLYNELVGTGSMDVGPAQVFQAAYTQDGGCLQGTPYDPAKGAVYHEDAVGTQKVVTIVPVNSASSGYPTLSLALKTSEQENSRYLGPLLPLNSADYDSIIGGPLCVNNPLVTK